MKVCRNCGLFVEYVIPKAPARPGWSHTPNRPTKGDRIPCEQADPEAAR